MGRWCQAVRFLIWNFVSVKVQFCEGSMTVDVALLSQAWVTFILID